MRRLFAASVVLLATVVASAGCTAKSGANEPAWQSAGAPQTADAGPGSTIAICSSLRGVVTTDMAPLGTALGAMVGRSTAGDDDDKDKAEDQAEAALKKLGTDISTGSATADDATLRQAGKTVEANFTALAADSSFLSGITTMDTMAAAITRLQQATSPVTTACADS